MTDNAERRAAFQRERSTALAERLDDWLQLGGDERALDVGSGAGSFAYAIAPRVGKVVAVEIDEALAAKARDGAPPNVEVVVADGEHLPFERASFDLAGTLRTLHHTPRPELLVAELVRVTSPGGTILVVDQIAPIDPLIAFDLNRFEHARDPTTTRVLAETDLRGLFDMNGLRLLREDVTRESRDLDAYLDLAGCEGDRREQARSLAPSGYEAIVGWYLLQR